MHTVWQSFIQIAPHIQDFAIEMREMLKKECTIEQCCAEHAKHLIIFNILKKNEIPKLVGCCLNWEGNCPFKQKTILY